MDSIIFNLNDNDKLVEAIKWKVYDYKHNIQVGDTNIQNFSDGETCVNFNTSVRGKRVFILTTPNTSHKLMQLYLAIDAAKRASASEIIPILPYFPYSRQDKKDQYRGPIGAKVVASTIEMCGATSLVTFDLHADQIVGFFNIPVNHLRGRHLFFNYIITISNSNTVLCSPDAGGVKRVKKLRDLISRRYENVNIPFVTIDKTRTGPNQIGEMNIIGNVEGRNVIIVDDLCDTGGTLIKAVDALHNAGASSVRALVTHGVLSGNAHAKLKGSRLVEFICSDSIEHQEGSDLGGKLTVISIADQIASVIIGINNGISFR